MSHRSNWLAAAVLVALSGCASAPAPKPVDLTQTCLTDIRQLPAHPVGIQAANSKKLKPRDYAEVAQCVQGSDGSKFAVALFKLDSVQMPVNLRVVMSESRGGVLAAAVTTLDENYAQIDRVGFDRFVNRGTTNTLDVVINNPATRYFLISPDSAEVGKSERQFRTQFNSTAIPVGLGAMIVLQTGHADESHRQYSAAGMLSVSVQPAGPTPVTPAK